MTKKIITTILFFAVGAAFVPNGLAQSEQKEKPKETIKETKKPTPTPPPKKP